MDAFETIMTRRSVRRFKSQPIAEELIEKILHAAMAAPSATNQQPWHFIIINNRELLNKIPAVHPYASMCEQSPIAIVVCIDTAQNKYRDFWVQDLSASTQNILLAARALELGAVWVGIYPNNERVQGFKQLLDLPESVIPFALIPLGYTDANQQSSPDRFNPERIHRNQWVGSKK